MPNAIVLRGLTKRIGQKTIVDNLTFDIPSGEVFGLLGPNGAGKTTTIRMMVGLIRMTSGTVEIAGHDIVRDYGQAIRQVGAIVENPEMYKYLSGYQNLRQFARMTPGIEPRRIDEVVEFVGLSERIHDKVRQYSLGMRQRLGLAQALLHRPSVLILDEPTNGLDPAGIRELRDHLRRLAREEGVAVVVSSHLLSEMELMCDRVAVIQQGRLVSVGRIDQMVAAGTDGLVRLFVETECGQEAKTALIGRVDGMADLAVVDGGIEMKLPRDVIPRVHQLLVQSDIPVFEVRIVTQTLEDRFLEMTGGGDKA
ncbi:putative ABC transporter ATP-binding protein YhcH [Alicyclobacillus hesperidum subsp. aegles]|uniref:ABC transporter ATP-binding protein n=1 Tax=Alicyclobacillus hesperidum TaxID=89784 RepID=UPI0007193D11|nr:ABC transporter ATP-binding protein [Alicyclobacillus hesperidum]KRW91727.1 bacitracin ABC transporter ATP-binding protein [Alicyclobacillus tengchongensis]GLG00269.1 putative ABC transporter ATP-binding protein YhcH [Alicyclobacillus hesperidum subsp. aegles]